MNSNDKIKELTTENAYLTTKNAQLKDENYELKRQLAVMRKMVFGSKSEKSKEVESSEQISLFNEAEANQNAGDRVEESEIVVAGHSRKKKRSRDEIFAELPTEDPKQTPCPSICLKHYCFAAFGKGSSHKLKQTPTPDKHCKLCYDVSVYF